MVSTDNWWNFSCFPHLSLSVVVVNSRTEQIQSLMVFHNGGVNIAWQGQTAWDWVSIMDAQIGIDGELEGGGSLGLERSAARQKS